MKLITDFHIHSKYARGCSNRLDVENIWKTCLIKGINIVGSGDFTHPQWFEELKLFLHDNGNGLFEPKKEYIAKWFSDIKNNLNQSVITQFESGNYPLFLLQTEINSVFSRGEKKSRIHNCFLIDSFDNAQNIIDYFGKFGSLESDGRLALRQDQVDTLSRLKANYPQSIFFSAHIWTPYFGVLGSRFGFSSMIQAYKDSYNLVDCIETGLSSDPIMNRMNSELDIYSIISTSDAHSPENLAREATVFESGNLSINQLTYKDIEKALKLRKYNKLKNSLNNIEKNYLINLFENSSNLDFDSTIEFFPQEGKYFGDGHKKCMYLGNPTDTVKRNGICPICGGKITIGVLHRSFQLGEKDRIIENNFGSKNIWSLEEIEAKSIKLQRFKYVYIVPLLDVIKDVFGANRGTKKSINIFNDLISKYGNEFDILLKVSIADLSDYSQDLANAIDKIRFGKVNIRSGFDGVYGIVSIGETKKDYISPQDNVQMQHTLF